MRCLALLAGLMVGTMSAQAQNGSIVNKLKVSTDVIPPVAGVTFPAGAVKLYVKGDFQLADKIKNEMIIKGFLIVGKERIALNVVPLVTDDKSAEFSTNYAPLMPGTKVTVEIQVFDGNKGLTLVNSKQEFIVPEIKKK